MAPDMDVSAALTTRRVEASDSTGLPDEFPLLPLCAWRGLHRDAYRAALKSGALRNGIRLERPLQRDRPAIVFIHGAFGCPAHFVPLAAALQSHVNRAIFVWNDTGRLRTAAEQLRTDLLRLPASTIVVAHSMGTLLPAYVGATDPLGLVRHLAAVYVNPLVGGSRYAGDFRALRWLRLGPVLQRLFFPPSVRDLAPESLFQQTICGRASAPSSFAPRTVILFTERHGQQPGVPSARIPRYFGRTRRELLARLGAVVELPLANGHNAPLREPALLLPILHNLLPGNVPAGPARPHHDLIGA